MSGILVTEEFLDTYEGEVMFLSQDLEDLAAKIQSAHFEEDDLELLMQNMLDVHDVFLSSKYTQHIAPIFNDFAEFIKEMNVEKLLSDEDTTTYLSAIILDLNTYINQYFIGRIFRDVYLFQDSLKNSIDFLKAAYEKEQDSTMDSDGSEILFL